MLGLIGDVLFSAVKVVWEGFCGGLISLHAGHLTEKTLALLGSRSFA